MEHEVSQKYAVKSSERRFMMMIVGAICVALAMVAVALALYVSSGAAQLDLSRPGYVSVRSQATRSDEFESFSSTGPIDTSTVDQFRQQFDKQAVKATSVDSFGGDVMSDQTLGIDAPSTDPSQN